MAKMESTLKNMLISLGGIALVCALLLAVVNALTEKKIARVQSEKTARAIAAAGRFFAFLRLPENLVQFLPENSGTVPYSCWMGMIRSSITVLD